VGTGNRKGTKGEGEVGLKLDSMIKGHACLTSSQCLSPCCCRCHRSPAICIPDASIPHFLTDFFRCFPRIFAVFHGLLRCCLITLLNPYMLQ